MARLRFGDDELGERPDRGHAIHAWYRVGNGPRGNVGAAGDRGAGASGERPRQRFTRGRNPLPARGGRAPEPMTQAKLNAPHAFRFGPDAMQRAITADDYARWPTARGVAAGSRRAWRGPEAGSKPRRRRPVATVTDTAQVAREVALDLEAFRRIGHDLGVRVAAYVPIDLAMTVCAAPESSAATSRARCSTPSAIACCRGMARFLSSGSPDVRRPPYPERDCRGGARRSGRRQRAGHEAAAAVGAAERRD